MDDLTNSSAIGRLLEEISWEGEKIRGYRTGGRGLENVMTTEVFMLLDFLPRRYLAAVLSATHGAQGVTAQLAAEAEEAELTLLPGDIHLKYPDVSVQPDVTISSPTCTVLLEAKRVKRSSFQPYQLAREYVALMQESAGKSPLLLLLGEPPPVAVKGMGRLELHEAVAHGIEGLVESGTPEDGPASVLLRDLSRRLTWITWSEIRAVVSRQLDHAKGEDTAIASETRLATALITAIDWHS